MDHMVNRLGANSVRMEFFETIKSSGMVQLMITRLCWLALQDRVFSKIENHICPIVFYDKDWAWRVPFSSDINKS